jgi:hypothetical protein
MPKLDFFAGSH